jgi:hypothetical protein
MAAAWGAPVPVVIGARLALEPGRGRTAAPVRSALLGAVLAVLIAVATLTFGSGLGTLVSHPARYGWNWNYALTSNFHVPPQAMALLGHDRAVAAYSGVSYANAQIDGQTVPIILASRNAQVTAPMLAGHPIEARNQIVLGAATLAQLHRRDGDTVTASYGTPADAPVYVPPTHLVIAGTATLPAIGNSQTLHTSMGTGRSSPSRSSRPLSGSSCTAPTLRSMARKRPSSGCAPACLPLQAWRRCSTLPARPTRQSQSSRRMPGRAGRASR